MENLENFAKFSGKKSVQNWEDRVTDTGLVPDVWYWEDRVIDKG
jgi:hypothetical protein